MVQKKQYQTSKTGRIVASRTQKTLNENETHEQYFKYVREAVLKVVQSASFTNMNNEYFVFDYRHGVDSCMFGDKTHDHIGVSAYVKNNRIYGACFSDKCNKKQHKLIGEITDNNNTMFERCTIIQVAEPWLSVETISSMSSLMANHETKCIAVKSECGSGKTKAVVELLTNYLKKHKQARILFISTRISYSHDLLNNTLNMVTQNTGVTFHNYKNIKDKEQWNKVSHLIISVESTSPLFG